jgi:DNA-binding NtrC family response regulator
MMKVLIAEDDVTSRTVLKHMLAEWGYEVVVNIHICGTDHGPNPLSHGPC